MTEAAPTLPELIRRALDSRLADVNVSMPGIVASYDPATRTASVRPALRRVLFDDDYERAAEDLPPIENVPVAWPGCAALDMHGVLAEGDAGVLVFATNSINEWLGTGAVSTPGDLKLHGLGGAMFFPGMVSRAAPAPDTDNSIGKRGATAARLGFTDTFVKAGAGGDFVALASLVAAELTAIKATLATGSNSGGPVVFSTPYPGPGNLAASNLKADP